VVQHLQQLTRIIIRTRKMVKREYNGRHRRSFAVFFAQTLGSVYNRVPIDHMPADPKSEAFRVETDAQTARRRACASPAAYGDSGAFDLY